MKTGNLFENIPSNLNEELCEVLASGSGSLRIERIVSRQHCSHTDFWYDQETTEWVMVLSGSGVLQFKEAEAIKMTPGDWLEIPPHQEHRVDSTDPDEDTVWLAIHWDS